MDKRLLTFAIAVVCVVAGVYGVRGSSSREGTVAAGSAAVAERGSERGSAPASAPRPRDGRLDRLEAALVATREAPPLPVEAPAPPRIVEDFEPPLEGAELELERTRAFFDDEVTPRLRECLAAARPSGRVKLSFLFVKGEDEMWRLARDAEELAAVGLQDTEAISLLDSTLPADVDDELLRCMHQAASELPLEPVERHRVARYYRVYWRWTFGG